MPLPPGPPPEEAFSLESLLRVLTASGSGNNSLCLQASRSDSFAGLAAPVKRTTFVRKRSIPTLLPLAPIFILRCDRNGRDRLLSPAVCDRLADGGVDRWVRGE